MEGLLKQTRSRFSRRDEADSTRAGRTPQRTGSFREKKPQKWFWRQTSREMNSDNLVEKDEYAAAVAATALAISSLESEELYGRNVPRTDSSLPRIRSDNNMEDASVGMTLPGELFPRSPENTQMVPEKTIHPIPTINRTPTMPKKRLSFADQLTEDLTKAPPSVGRTPTVKRTSTFDDNEFENGGRIRPPRRGSTVKKTPSYSEDTTLNDGRRMAPDFLGLRADLAPPPALHPPPVPPLSVHPPVPSEGARRHVDQESDVEGWEHQQMAKIKQRYDKLNATILEWEDNKRKKARRKLETSESEVEKRRAKAMHKYQMEMEHIKQIADGARAQAKVKRGNEELKVMEKANRYRATGEPPVPPVCRCL